MPLSAGLCPLNISRCMPRPRQKAPRRLTLFSFWKGEVWDSLRRGTTGYRSCNPKAQKTSGGRVSNDEEVLYEGLGIVDVGPGMKEGRSYAVSFTLFVDASSPHQALERAMQFRNIIGMGDPAQVHGLPFQWHLHEVQDR
jgi:hypothetical protein